MLAPHYARPMPRAATMDAIVRTAPSNDAEPVARLTAGDVFAVLEFASGWAWGFVQTSHLVGYAPAHALGGAETP